MREKEWGTIVFGLVAVTRTVGTPSLPKAGAVQTKIWSLCLEASVKVPPLVGNEENETDPNCL